jgi:hypothetical protein
MHAHHAPGLQLREALQHVLPENLQLLRHLMVNNAHVDDQQQQPENLLFLLSPLSPLSYLSPSRTSTLTHDAHSPFNNE